MENSFIKSELINKFSNQAELLKDLDNSCTDKNTLFLLKHNIFALSKIFNFLNNDDKLFILRGGIGAGKSDVLKYSSEKFVSENTLVFKILFNGAITLDDILLRLYKDFSTFHFQKRIVLPKTNTSVFSEKINVYIKHINTPMLFIFDMLELNFLTPKKQNEIINFIKYLTNFDNIKIIVSSRSLLGSEFNCQDKLSLITLQPLIRDEYKSYFELNKATITDNELEQLLVDTKGQYVFLRVFVELLKSYACRSTDLFDEFKKKNLYFTDFLIQKQLSLFSDEPQALFYFLSTIRVGVDENFLIKKQLTTKDKLHSLIEQNVISHEFGVCYLKDYYKTQYLQQTSSDIKIKLYRELSKFYENLLPQKPFEREVFISRLTMRNEIEYCEEMLKRLILEAQKPKKKKTSGALNFDYLNYSNSMSSEWTTNKTKLPDFEPINIPEIPKKQMSKSHRYEFYNEDMTLLNLTSRQDVIETELLDFVKQEENNTKGFVSKEVDNSVKEKKEDFEELIKEAAYFEKRFEYKLASDKYLKALTFKNHPLFKEKEPILTAKLATCYKKIQETEKAVENFRRAYELYNQVDASKAVYMLLYIAQSYNEVYRFDEAEEMYKHILDIKTSIPQEVSFRVCLDLSEIEASKFNSQTALKYAHSALQIAEKLQNKKLMSESYFKYALCNDDLNNKSMALKYYLQCIQTSQNVEENKFLSSAYSNLALMASENKDIQTAIMYHQKSLEVDKELKNNYGLFFGYINLAKIYKNQNLSLAFEYLYKALKIIRRMNDKTATINVYMELGDCYMQSGDAKQALKAYFHAEKLISKTNSIEDLFTIESKLKILQSRIGKEQFDVLTNTLRQK